MSTRSGKRLHNSSSENIEPELNSKKNKKTRSKRVIENDEDHRKTKKRQNYVSFPVDEETAVAVSVENETKLKSARVLRRNTLKEQNEAANEVDTAVSIKKQARSTRRTKKFSESVADDVTVVAQTEKPVEEITVVTTKVKGKKNKNKSNEVEEETKVVDKENNVKKAGKKKKNKRKKNSQSKPVVDLVDLGGKKKNKSNMSADSFHSAAGSPTLENITSSPNKSSPRQAETHIVTTNTKRKSSLKEVDNIVIPNTKVLNEVYEKVITNVEEQVDVRQNKRRRSSLKITLPDQDSKSHMIQEVGLNTTFEKESTLEGPNTKKSKSNSLTVNSGTPTSNLDLPKASNVMLNTTFEKDETDSSVKKNKKPECKEKEYKSRNLNLSFEIRKSPRKSVNNSEKTTALNGTFDMSPKPDPTKEKSLDSTFDKETKLDSTFDNTTQKSITSSKSSLVTSDDATNSSIITLDRSDSSKINITDDDSKTENILNTSPLLIESSMEESKVLESSLKQNKTPESQTKKITTPLKREGTFIKDGPDSPMSPKTPNKRLTLPAAGCTPYHSNGKSSQKRSILNLTHSIEKQGRRSSLAEVLPRATRVMFCSPVNNPGVATQRKSKIIKSNLKGSNKSFVFDESMSSLGGERSGRKRSHTHTEGAVSGAKRSRLAPPAAPPRARTVSAAAKLSNTPAPCGSPGAPRSELKATRAPNFAALHARRFERMESLGECQQRRARRARRLLAPAGVAVLDRTSPRVTLEAKPRDTPPKSATPAKASKLPTLDTLQRGYTRFGFKMNCDVNPFNVPATTDKKPKETKPNSAVKQNGVTKPNGVVKPNALTKPNGVVKPNAIIKPTSKPPLNFSLARQGTLPSLAGATSLRRELAKQTIMREKSFNLAEKRNESRKEVRTVIKGVRTNRRFELQMKSRNING